MKVIGLTDAEIEKLVAADVDMLKAGNFPDMRLEHDGPNWSDELFLAARKANLEWWIENGPKDTD